MKRTAIFLTTCCTMFAPLSAELLILRSGKTAEGAITSSSPLETILDNKYRVPNSRIAEIYFSDETPFLPDQETISKKDEARREELFRKAQDAAAQYPDAKAVILEKKGAETLRPDGTRLEKKLFSAVLRTNRAIEDYQSFSEYLDGSREKLTVKRATVYLPDGKIIPFEPSFLKLSDPQQEEGIYIKKSGITYSFPELVPGSVIEYEYERETYAPFKKEFFFPSWSFMEKDPVLSSSFSVMVPSDAPFFYSTEHFLPDDPRRSPNIGTEDKYISYTWTLNNIAPLKDEPKSPPLEELSPSVKGSLFKEWDKLYSWFAAMYGPNMFMTDSLQDTAQKLTKGLSTDEEKTAAIYYYVQSSIKYAAAKMSMESAWGGYSADKTLKRKVGCCIDKAILMSALLTASGIKAYPVITKAGYGKISPSSVPDFDFDHAFVKVTLPDKTVFLDPTGFGYRYPFMPAHDYNIDAADVLASTSDHVSAPSVHADYSAYQYNIAIKPGGDADITMQGDFSGEREAAMRRYYRNLRKDDIRIMIEDRIKEFSQDAELKTYEMTDTENLLIPFTVKVEFSIKNSLISAGDLRIFSLPGSELYFEEAASDSRENPLVYNTPYARHSLYSIDLPPGLELLSAPQTALIKTGAGMFNSQCGKRASGLVCEFNFEQYALNVSPKEYPRFKNFLDTAEHITRQKIFLKEKID